LSYTPFKKTTLSAHYEDMKGHSRTPSRVPPLDKVRVWYQAGDLGSAVVNKLLFANDLTWQARRNNPDTRVFSTSGDGAISVIGGNNPAGVRPIGGYYSLGVQNIAAASRWPGVVDPVNAGTTRGVSLLTDDYYPRDT